MDFLCTLAPLQLRAPQRRVRLGGRQLRAQGGSFLTSRLQARVQLGGAVLSLLLCRTAQLQQLRVCEFACFAACMRACEQGARQCVRPPQQSRRGATGSA